MSCLLVDRLRVYFEERDRFDELRRWALVDAVQLEGLNHLTRRLQDLLRLDQLHAADEIMAVTNMYYFEDRKQSFALLMDAFSKNTATIHH